ncbi:hypothetical protein CH63R_06520 [Colletotrichum higginsianum IMI 349063]|uniref:Uncharacterized protein n=1 Tax=Colletotrichum higginsianum (strain IMI 349063) TaxID=759273 RepID=A0A1B7YGA8_COLHI|nr:hypothetical protein CH63R_06520 [Colletotrichum higginsianum IMI 349063]OBR10828.1 hypothetical protein CH63R_06520 [Colletotrichum higginsianum IMI 349063]
MHGQPSNSLVSRPRHTDLSEERAEGESPKSASSDVRVGSHARTAASPGLWRRLDSRQSVQKTEPSTAQPSTAQHSTAQHIWLVGTHAPTDEQMMISMASRDGNELRRDVMPV